jgi:integrase/recombinase XerD
LVVAENNIKPLLLKEKRHYLVVVEGETPPGGEGMKPDVIISEYQNHLKALGYADSTVEIYRKNLGQFKRFLKEQKITDLRKVHKKTIQAYKAQVMAEKNAMETKALKLRPVKRLFEHLVENNKLFINPTEGLVETCRKNRKIGTVLTVAEVQKLMEQPNLSFAMEIRNRAIMEVFYTSGIRLNELIRLAVHDVDFKEKMLYIRKAKGSKQRVVPLGKTARHYLREYLDKIRPRHSKRNPKERALFLKNTGETLTPDVIRQAIRDYRIKAGIKKPVSPHTFRRTCATHLVQQGADIRYVQKLLGHSRLSTTQTYTKVVPVEVKKSHNQHHPGKDL